jgi:hypothetical protein
MQGPNWWKKVSSFLQQDSCCQENLEAYNDLKGEAVSDGFKKVGGGGKTSTGDEYFKRWCAGKSKFDGAKATSESGIWSLDKPNRTVHLEKWRSEYNKEFMEDVAYWMTEYNKCSLKLRKLTDRKKLGILQNAKIIGCTTTSGIHDLVFMYYTNKLYIINCLIQFLLLFSGKDERAASVCEANNDYSRRGS